MSNIKRGRQAQVRRLRIYHSSLTHDNCSDEWMAFVYSVYVAISSCLFFRLGFYMNIFAKTYIDVKYNKYKHIDILFLI